VIILTKQSAPASSRLESSSAKASPELPPNSVATMLTPGKYAAEAMREFDVKGALT